MVAAARSRQGRTRRPALPGGVSRALAPLAASGLLALLGTGCAAPALSRMDNPQVRFAQAHPEPELAGHDAQRAPRPATEAAAPTVNGGAPATHRVEPGQTLFRIARLHGVSVEALSEANGITDPRTLAVGQALVIPGQPQPQPQPAAPSPAGASVAAPEPPPRGSPPPSGRRDALVMPTAPGILDWPLKGVLYARFGTKGKERHDGIDLAAPLGTPVTVARAGTVLYAGEQKGYGQIVIVDHGDDLVTLYAHNRDLRVKTGQKVRDGQVVATVGQTGRTSGPHLHFEVRRKGLPVDPLEYLGPPPDRRALGRRPR
jgi:lipoprotein NlpD